MQIITMRLGRWAIGIVLLLAIPWVLSIISGAGRDGWNWSFFDYIFMGALLFGAALTYELIARRMPNTAYRIGIGVAVMTGLLLLWINAAVGIIGDGDLDSPNGLYLVVLAVGFAGSYMADFRPKGVARALFMTALAQMLVPVFAVLIKWQDFSPGITEVFLLNAVFATMFIVAALLLRQAANRPQ